MYITRGLSSMPAIIIRICFLSAIICLSSCSSKTQEIADKVQGELPLCVAGFGEVSSVYAEDDWLVFSIDATSDGLDYNVVRKENYELSIDSVGGSVINKLGILRDLCDTGVSVIFRYEWDRGTKLDTRISNSEIIYMAVRDSKKMAK